MARITILVGAGSKIPLADVGNAMKKYFLDCEFIVHSTSAMWGTSFPQDVHEIAFTGCERLAGIELCVAIDGNPAMKCGDGAPQHMELACLVRSSSPGYGTVFVLGTNGDDIPDLVKQIYMQTEGQPTTRSGKLLFN